MIVKIHPDNPQPRLIKKVCEILSQGGVMIYPTDTLYGIGCDLCQPKAIERIARLKGIPAEKAQFSIVFRDLSHIAEYCKLTDNKTFKLLKRHLPGPFTFILEANNKIPKILTPKKKTIGVRIPDHSIVMAILKEFGHPILTTSVKNNEEETTEYFTDPELIHDRYRSFVDIVIDGGYGNLTASTIVDCTGEMPVILRQGAGILEI